MTNLHHTEDIADDPNQKALEELARAIEWDVGQFALISARCNSASLRSHLIQQLREICSVEIREIVLDKSVTALYSTIQAEFAEVQPSALMVCGLESVSALDRLLTGANQVREEFRENFHFPSVWWVTDEVLQKLIRLAPDLQSWFTTVEFKISTEELIHCIQRTAAQVFAKVLDTGAGIFLDHAALNLGSGSTSCSELESARHELDSRGVRLDSELEASLEFVLSRAVDNSMEESRQHLERSLALWQQLAPLTPQSWGELESQSPSELGQEQLASQSWRELESQSPPELGDLGGEGQNSQSLERIGCVLHSLGLWWRSYAERHRSEYEVACSRAKEYFQQCVAVFEQAQRPDLVAKFINALGEILQRLQQWDELDAVAKKALALHQTYPDSIRLARSHGFLAEVHLAKSAWTKAKHAAETALSILASRQSPASDAVSSEQSANLDWVRSYHQGWYLFSLARAHSSLGHAQEAIATLETAAAETKPYYDPELYIRILEELRSLYFKQGDYLKAFHIKQDQRSIEQQYGFRAFVGAGRLQPKLEVANPALSGIATQGTVAQEIAASGRQQDVNRLVERIGRSDHKLTVIQGQSGVGKSSLVQAGLIPALKQKAMGTRDVVPVLQQVYTDWVRELGKRLREALVECGNLKSDLTPQPHQEQGKGESGSSLFVGEGSFSEELGERSILDQLRKNAEQNLLTVLIFDQFEEFFFVCQDPIQRRQFYEFMRDALDIPYVKVILSLREDYLYYLLECNNRLISLEVINNNILDKHILYYLGNFSVEDAKSVIQNLTELAQFVLEPALIDALVKDLAGELGEVRPIELQVVGAQLQTEKIGKLEQYQKHGPKEKLVERFLEEVVKDCGSENEQIAKLVLYLLTDENNTRPLKTRADLELELDVSSEKLDLVLEIFVKSRLVFQVPALPVDRYQLVHDYLVAFVRQQQSARLIAELEKEREQRKLTEAKLNQALKRQLRTARRATFTLVGLVAAFGGFAAIATLVGINTYITTLSLSSNQEQELNQLVSAIKAGKQLKWSVGVMNDIQTWSMANLNQGVYGVRELNRLEGHTGSVTSVSFSPNGKRIATVSEDKTVKVWSLEGTLIANLTGHTKSITDVSFSPDGELLASASEDKSVKVWRLNNNSLITTLEGHKDSVTSISFSPSGKMLASAGKDKTIRIWSIDGTLLTTFVGSTENITNVSFSPDDKMLASASEDEKVKIFSLDGRLISIINNYGTLSINFSSDGQTLILNNKDNTVKFYTLDGTLLKNVSSGSGGYNTNVSLSPNGELLALVRSYDQSTVELTTSNGDYLGISFGGHEDSITDLSFSPDGKVLASASKDKTVRLWSLNSLAFKLPEAKSSSAYRVMFSPDGKTIAAVDYDNKVRLWSNKGTLLKTIQGDGSVLNFSPNGKSLVTGSAEEVVRLWSLDGREIPLKGHNSSITSINFSPDGQLIASASEDNFVRLWKSDGTFIKILKGHTDSVTNVSFSPDSQIIASIDEDNWIKLWRRDGTPIKTLKGHTERVTSVSFSPNSQLITSIGEDNLVKLWGSDGTPIKTLKGHTERVTSVSFSPDSQIIASVSQGSKGERSTIKLWQHDGTRFASIDNYGIESIKFSPDGRIIASINKDKTVKLWNLDSKLIATLEHNGTVTDVSFSPDGKTIASASADNTIKLWRRDGTSIETLRRHSAQVNSISFSPDGETLVSVSDDKMVQLWSRDGKELRTLQKPSEENNSTNSNRRNIVRFSSDGRIITLVSVEKNSSNLSNSYTVKLWNRYGEELKSIQGRSGSDSANYFGKISISPDGRTVAIANKVNALKLWNLDGTPLNTLEHSDKVNSVSFSTDGKTLASASDDQTVKLWNSDGMLRQTLKGHSDKVNSVSFSADGKTLASASDDQTVRLWNSDGTLRQILKGHSDKVNSVSFSPNSKTLASVSDDNTLKLWRSRNGKELKTIEGSSGSPIRFSFSPDSRLLAVLRTNYFPSMAELYILDGIWFQQTQLQGIKIWSDLSFSPDGKALTAASSDGVLVLSLELDKLLKRGCEWAHGYLKNNSNAKRDRKLCDDILRHK